MVAPQFEKTFSKFRLAENVRRRLIRYGYHADISPIGDTNKLGISLIGDNYKLVIPAESDTGLHAHELQACLPDVHFTLVGID